MKIFLIAGKAGSGKHNVATLIKEHFIYEKKETIITGYSKYLKLYAEEIIGWDRNENEKPRKFLQDLGVKIRTELGMPEFFTDRMLDDIKVYEQFADVVVVDDVRLPGEIEIIKEVYDDVTSILVINQFGDSKLTVEEQVHPTETALENYDKFDYTVINSDSNQLREDIFKILGD